MSLKQVLVKRWQARIFFPTWFDWMRSNYSWVLFHARRYPLPGRNKVRTIRLAGARSPFAVRLGTSDLPVVQEIFVDGEYAEVVTADLGPVNTILDLGTNIGISLRFWHEHFPKARLIGVEPDADNLAMCSQNLALCGMEGATLVRACVGGNNRLVILDRQNDAWGIRMRDVDGQNAGEVPVYDFESLLKHCGNPAVIDLMKCDIEGAEQELFATCGRWIHRVRNIVIELHAPYLRESFLNDIAKAGGRFDVRDLQADGGVQVLLLTRSRD